MTITISRELTGEHVETLCQWLLAVDSREEGDVRTDLLRLNLNCTGGAPHNALAAVNALLEYPRELTTYACGYCVGAGVLLLACGKVRAAHPAARFLVGGMQDIPDYPVFRDGVEGPIPGPTTEASWYNTWHDNFLKGRTKEPVETWQWLRESGSAWFGVDAAMEFGLITEVRGWRTD